MTKVKEKKPSVPLPDGKIRRNLIGALISDPKNCVWPIEMRMINCLLKKHNEPEFWTFVSTRYKFNSLRHLLAQPNIIFQLRLEYTKNKSLELKVPEVAVLAPEKVGEDIIIQQQKPKTLKDFIQGI
jgi:hypothetical protein